MISDDPPPMSNMTIERASRSARSPTPAAARWASVSRPTISSSMPSCSRTRSTKSDPLTAERQASVAMVRARVTPARDHLVATDAQGLERAGDRGLAEAPGQRQALAETDDAGKRVDHPEAVRGRPGDQEPAIVGAKVQSRVGRSRAPVSESSQRPSERRVDPLRETQRGNFRQNINLSLPDGQSSSPGCIRLRM